jgi:hypothetical protein
MIDNFNEGFFEQDSEGNPVVKISEGTVGGVSGIGGG